MNRIIFLFFLLLSVNASFSQVVKVDLNWSQTHSHEVEGKVYPLRFIENQGVDNGLPYFFSKTKTNSTQQKVVISDIVTEQIPSTDLTYYKASFVQVAEDFIIEASVTDEAGLPFLVLHAVPIRLRNGVYERVVQFSYQLSPSVPLNEKDFVQNSVMKSGSGTWYKISVEKDGIYKIDKAFLESCGINTTGLNPAHIHIYGNGDGLLPEKNNLPRTDDLAENAIYVMLGVHIVGPVQKLFFLTFRSEIFIVMYRLISSILTEIKHLYAFKLKFKMIILLIQRSVRMTTEKAMKMMK